MFLKMRSLVLLKKCTCTQQMAGRNANSFKQFILIAEIRSAILIGSILGNTLYVYIYIYIDQGTVPHKPWKQKKATIARACLHCTL